MSNQTNNAGCNSPGLSFQMPDYHRADDYLYTKGPWPQKPSGDNPCSIAPEVCATSIPDKEWDDWREHLETYYKKHMEAFGLNSAEYAVTVLGIAKPDSWGITKLGDWLFSKAEEEMETLWHKVFKTHLVDDVFPYPALDDKRFTELIAHGVLSKLLCKLDAPDEDLFKDFLQDAAREYWKCDASHMRAVRKPWDNEHLAPTIVLLARPRNATPGQEDAFQVLAIALYGQAQRGGPYDQQPRIYQPGDGKAWQLAKYFALQGALIRLNLIDHPMVHFPPDAINAITKTALPKSNLLLQLLLPHFRLSLAVDNSVLEGALSLLNRTTSYPYSPYPAKGEEIRKVFPFYWAGSDYFLNKGVDEDDFWKNRRNAFPKYSFALEPREIPSRYCTFLNAYYGPILNFTRQVVQSLPKDDSQHDWEDIRKWADYVASWVPGFPDAEKIIDKEILAKTLASIIWNAAIVHSADHFMMHALFEQQQPLPYVMHDQPPVAAYQGAGSDFQAAASPGDVGSARLCDLLFFMPHNSSLLIECTYDFDLGILQDAVSAFHDELRATAKRLLKSNLDFGIKLKGSNPTEDEHQCFGAGVQY